MKTTWKSKCCRQTLFWIGTNLSTFSPKLIVWIISNTKDWDSVFFARLFLLVTWTGSTRRTQHATRQLFLGLFKCQNICNMCSSLPSTPTDNSNLFVKLLMHHGQFHSSWWNKKKHQFIIISICKWLMLSDGTTNLNRHNIYCNCEQQDSIGLTKNNIDRLTKALSLKTVSLNSVPIFSTRRNAFAVRCFSWVHFHMDLNITTKC